MEHDDITARLARLEARRQPASRPAAASATNRGKRPHPAQRSRIAAGVMSVAAMVGITGYMAVHDHSAATASSGVTNTANVSNTLSSGLSAATPALAAPQANTVTKGS